MVDTERTTTTEASKAARPAKKGSSWARVANAPCSWGLVGQGAPAMGYAQMLDELAGAGYEGTELGDLGFMPTSPAELRTELLSRDLTMLGAFVALDLRSGDGIGPQRGHLLDVARLIAAVSTPGDPPFLVLADQDGTDPVRLQHAGSVTPEMGLPDDAWRTLTRNAEEAARIVLGETGLRTVFHPHCGGFVETPEETERFLDGTDHDVIGLVFDTGHYVYGSGGRGDDLTALAGLRRFWDRTDYVHLKDCSAEVATRARSVGLDYVTAVRQGLYCELGDGTVDFAGIAAFLRDRGYSGWLTVEQDVLPGMGTPKESAERSREYLRGIGL